MGTSGSRAGGPGGLHPMRSLCLASGMAWLGALAAWLGLDDGAAPAALAAGALFLCLVAVAPFRPRWQVHAPCLARVRTERPVLALTFDDGPDPHHTPAILACLEAHGAKATFFVIGGKAARHPALIARMVAAGHQVENHTWSHSRLTPLSVRRTLERELEETSALIARHTGSRPRWLRPPFGIVSPPVALGASRAGLSLCAWSTTARDGLEGQTAARALRRLRRGLAPGAILALHDAAERGDRTPIARAVLGELLREMDDRGLSSVTLDALVEASRGAQRGKRPRR